MVMLQSFKVSSGQISFPSIADRSLGQDTTSELSSAVSSELVPSSTVSSEALPPRTSKVHDVSIHPNPAPKESKLVSSSMKSSSATPSHSLPSSVVTSVVQVVEQSMNAATFKTSVSSSSKGQVAPFANSTCAKCKPSSASSSPLPTATTCGEVGPFTLDVSHFPPNTLQPLLKHTVRRPSCLFPREQRYGQLPSYIQPLPPLLFCRRVRLRSSAN